MVWERMIAFRGQDRGSALIGSSTRHQRIERLWRVRCFGNVFYYTFKSMEESGLLDITNLLHLFVLQNIELAITALLRKIEDLTKSNQIFQLSVLDNAKIYLRQKNF